MKLSKPYKRFRTGYTQMSKSCFWHPVGANQVLEFLPRNSNPAPKGWEPPSPGGQFPILCTIKVIIVRNQNSMFSEQMVIFTTSDF